VTRESELRGGEAAVTPRERLQKAADAVFAARDMLARCPDEYRDERASLLLDVQEATEKFFSVQQEVFSVEKKGTPMIEMNMKRAQEDADVIDALVKGVAPPPRDEVVPVTFTKRVSGLELTFKPITHPVFERSAVAPGADFRKDFDEACAGPQTMSPGQIAAENNMRRIHNEPLLTAQEVDLRVHEFAKSSEVLTQEEREQAYRSGRRSPVGHSVRKVDPETGEEHLVRIVTGYR
jgi:hypothetical protein